MYEEVLRRGLPSGVALEEGPEGKHQIAVVSLVVAIERRQDAVGEGPQGLRVLERQEQLICPQVRELGLGPAVGPAELQRVASLPHALEKLFERDQAAGAAQDGAAGPGRHRCTQVRQEPRPLGLDDRQDQIVERGGQEGAARLGQRLLACQGQRLERIGSGEHGHRQGPREVEPQPAEGQPSLAGGQDAAEDLIQQIPLEAPLRVGHGSDLRQLEGEEGEGVARDDPVELGQRLLLAHGQERLDPALGRDGLDRAQASTVRECDAGGDQDGDRGRECGQRLA